MGESLRIVDFASLDAAELEQLNTLQVSPQQEVLGGSFRESIDACISGSADTLRGWCFTLGNTVVGMVVFKRPPTSPDWVAPDDMSVHGLKIDQNWQGRGLGRKALALGVDAAARAWPDVENLVLAVDADNPAALAIYRGSGMTDSGPTHIGPRGPEHRMRKAIER